MTRVTVSREKGGPMLLSRSFVDVEPQEAIGAVVGYLKAEGFEGEFYFSCTQISPAEPAPEVSP